MGMYLGCIEVKENREMRFYHVRPIYSFDGETQAFSRLTPERLAVLLPGSSEGNIRLYAPNRNFWMFNHLHDRQLVFLEISPEELEERRLHLPNLCSKHKIKLLEQAGYYQVVPRMLFRGEPVAGGILPVACRNLYPQQPVCLLQEHTVLLGPYPVQCDTTGRGFWVDLRDETAGEALLGYVMPEGIGQYIQQIDCGDGEAPRLLLYLPADAQRVAVDCLRQPLPQTAPGVRQSANGQPCSYEQVAANIAFLPLTRRDTGELADQLCRAIQAVRPAYGRNWILNCFLCICQGMLTVFGGRPGAGKTSLCNCLAAALGLDGVPALLGDGAGSCHAGRFVPVSVGYGWHSSRDWIGQYNPHTDTFLPSDRRLYDGLRILDCEQAAGISRLPFLVLLDEANLSRMEYYWADFMQACGQDVPAGYCVNLGSGQQLCLPETLRFMATVNIDQTTVCLSPRLLDRAWVICLPDAADGLYTDTDMPQPAPVQWTDLQRLFAPEGTPAGAAAEALDFAIAQRVVPKLFGNDAYTALLAQDLWQICMELDLQRSAQLVENMLQNGQIYDG